MFRRLVVVMCLAGMLVGCGGDSTRGVNRDRDRPRSTNEKDKVEKDKADKIEKDKAEKGKADKVEKK